MLYFVHLDVADTPEINHYSGCPFGREMYLISHCCVFTCYVALSVAFICCFMVLKNLYANNLTCLNRIHQSGNPAPEPFKPACQEAQFALHAG